MFIHKLYSKDELERLARTISEVERGTSGELRLMVVSQSIRTRHVYPLVAFALTTFALLVLWLFRYHLILNADWFLIPLLIAGCMAVAWPISCLARVQRALTADLDEQVFQRAEVEFHREGLSQTAGRTGILIFLSLLEHRAVVLGDRAIAEKLQPEVWSEVIATLLAGAKQRQWYQQTEAAIKMCGLLLTKHFPIAAGDKNELPNHVIVKP